MCCVRDKFYCFQRKYFVSYFKELPLNTNSTQSLFFSRQTRNTQKKTNLFINTNMKLEKEMFVNIVQKYLSTLFYIWLELSKGFLFSLKPNLFFNTSGLTFIKLTFPHVAEIFFELFIQKFHFLDARGPSVKMVYSTIV